MLQYGKLPADEQDIIHDFANLDLKDERVAPPRYPASPLLLTNDIVWHFDPKEDYSNAPSWGSPRPAKQPLNLRDGYCVVINYLVLLNVEIKILLAEFDKSSLDFENYFHEYLDKIVNVNGVRDAQIKRNIIDFLPNDYLESLGKCSDKEFSDYLKNFIEDWFVNQCKMAGRDKEIVSCQFSRKFYQVVESCFHMAPKTFNETNYNPGYFEFTFYQLNEADILRHIYFNMGINFIHYPVQSMERFGFQKVCAEFYLPKAFDCLFYGHHKGGTWVTTQAGVFDKKGTFNSLLLSGEVWQHKFEEPLKVNEEQVLIFRKKESTPYRLFKESIGQNHHNYLQICHNPMIPLDFKNHAKMIARSQLFTSYQHFIHESMVDGMRGAFELESADKLIPTKLDEYLRELPSNRPAK